MKMMKEDELENNEDKKQKTEEKEEMFEKKYTTDMRAGENVSTLSSLPYPAFPLRFLLFFFFFQGS